MLRSTPSPSCCSPPRWPATSSAARPTLRSARAPRRSPRSTLEIGTVQPGRQPVETGEENPFVRIELIELVADLPLRIGRDDHLFPEPRPAGEPGLERGARPRGDREQTVLVDDPVVD